MNDQLSPVTVPTGIKVKRLNRLPLLIVFVLSVLVFSAFGYLIIQSGKRQQATADDDVLPYSSGQAQAETLLAGKPQHGVINAAEIPAQPAPAPTPEAPTPQPAPQPEKMTADQKEMERIRLAKLKQLEAALSAPSATSSGNFKASLANYTTTPQTTGGGKGLESPIAKLASYQNDMRQGLLSAEESDPNKQQEKRDFFMEKQPITGYLQHTRVQQQSPLEVKTGTIIPATMIGGLNSDLPGMILAQVSQNVFDTATGSYLLIPQGSRLVGTYDSFVAYGQDRALVAWNRIVYPDGSTLELEGMPGTDPAGYAGLEDQVDHHYFRIFGSALLMSVITGIYDYTQGNTGDRYYNEETAGDSMARAVARELTQTSQMLLRKNLNIQPTIKIRPGYKLNVMVKRDIIFPDVW